MKKALLLVIILLAVSTTIYCHKDTLRVQAFKLSSELNLDGILDETIWQNQAIEQFTQKDPNEGEPSSERTKVWVAYNDTYIYVAARLYDSTPTEIDETIARRDTYVPSDWFFFEVDSYNDNKTGYFFAVNAGGTIADGIYFNDSWDDGSWDGIWEAKTNVDDEGWTVEMRIPFSQIRFQESDNMIWGVNFERHIKKNNEKSYFIMVPKTESGYVSHFADLVGLEGVKPKQRFEFLPYIVQRAQYLIHDENDPFYSGNQYKTSIGADFKVGIGSNFNLDATILPDFGQVEVDPAELNLSAFETYYQEKRPFFIEGSSILTMFGNGGANNNWGFNFGTPDLFYSRRIGRSPKGYINSCEYANYPTETRILGAAKLTGKIDENWEMGVLSTVTERTYAELYNAGERTSQEVEPFTHYGVFRSKKEFNDGRQAIGMIFTSVNRDLSNGALKSQYSSGAYTFGLDGWTFLDEDKEYVLTANVIGSHTTGTKEYMWKLQKAPYRYFQRPDATFMPFDSNRTSLEGLYSRIVLNKQKGNFYVNAALGIATPGFEYNDLGYQWFADRIAGHVVLGYRWFEPDGLFRYKSLYTAYTRQTDFEGNLLRNGIFLMSSAQFENYYSVDLQLMYNFESLSKDFTRGGPYIINPATVGANLSVSSDDRKSIIIETFGGYFIDEMKNKEYHYGIELEWKPSPQLSISFGPSIGVHGGKFQWVGKFDDPNATETYGTRYVVSNIDNTTLGADFRLNWTFNPTMSLQVYVQPYFSVGEYTQFKEIAKSRSLQFNIYGENGSTIDYDEAGNYYEVDPDGVGPSNAFTFGNPNFNFKSFKANLVYRWELLPGSVLFLVWTHGQMDFKNPGDFSMGRDFKDLMSADSDDVFLAKFSYWFDM